MTTRLRLGCDRGATMLTYGDAGIGWMDMAESGSLRGTLFTGHIKRELKVIPATDDECR